MELIHELIARLFQRRESGGSYRPGGFWGGGGPPRAGLGQRLKSIGPAGEGTRLGRAYRPGFGWQSLGLAAIVVVTAAIVLVPSGVLDRITHGPPGFSHARPDVLVVSAKATDQAAVAQTVTARGGYSLRPAASVEAGLEELRREPDRIGFVVVDGDMADARRMIGAVRGACPGARLVVLTGPRGAGDISSRLVDAGVN